ncbi:hypothetical protein [Caedibacter taeniospiralis]|jgi:hypothetical protein|uniref:hypothetical protein n=1 Tax=Caedibacter taeniospiralis TaxID=28907 RepID=UPI0037C0CA4A
MVRAISSFENRAWQQGSSAYDVMKNSGLYNFPEPVEGKKRGRSAKYAAKAGSVGTLANEYKSMTLEVKKLR